MYNNVRVVGSTLLSILQTIDEYGMDWYTSVLHEVTVPLLCDNTDQTNDIIIFTVPHYQRFKWYYLEHMKP